MNIGHTVASDLYALAYRFAQGRGAHFSLRETPQEVSARLRGLANAIEDAADNSVGYRISTAQSVLTGLLSSLQPEEARATLTAVRQPASRRPFGRLRAFFSTADQFAPTNLHFPIRRAEIEAAIRDARRALQLAA